MVGDRGAHDRADQDRQHEEAHRDAVADLFCAIERAADDLDRLVALEQQVEADDELISQDKRDALRRIERYRDDTARAEAEEVFRELEADPMATRVDLSAYEGMRVTFAPGIRSDQR